MNKLNKCCENTIKDQVEDTIKEPIVCSCGKEYELYWDNEEPKGIPKLRLKKSVFRVCEGAAGRYNE